MPGPPRAEMCNAFDDDCDGVIDNGHNLCANAMVCHKGLCLTREEAAEAAANEPPPPPVDAGAAGGRVRDGVATEGGTVAPARRARTGTRGQRVSAGGWR